MSTTVIAFDQTLLDAASCYTSRKARNAHPDGHTDNGGRWYPSMSERQSCCDTVRGPSRAYPWSYMLHCRTVGHIARLYGVDEAQLRRAVRQQTPKRTVAKSTRYKVVRVSEGPEPGELTYHSLYEPHLLYALGATYRQAAKPHHGGGYYVRPLQREVPRMVRDETVLGYHYETDAISLEHDFLAGRVADSPRPGTYAILECAVWGKCIPYSNGKEAWTYLCPVAVHSTFSID